MNIFKDFGLYIKEINVNNEEINIDIKTISKDIKVILKEDSFIEDSSLKELNINLFNIMKLSLNYFKELNLSYFDIFNKENKTKIKFNYKNKEYNFDIDWIKARVIKEIELPNMQNHIAGNIFDKETLAILIKDYQEVLKSDNHEDIIYIKMILTTYIDLIIMNRFMFIFFFIQSIISFEEMKELSNIDIYKKNKYSFTKTIKNKKLKFKIETTLLKDFSIKTSIVLNYNKNKIELTNEDSELNFEKIKEAYLLIFNKKIDIKNSDFLIGNSTFYKKKYDIISTRNIKVKENLELIINYSSLYKNGYHFSINEENLELDEVYFPNELFKIIKKDLDLLF